MNKDWLKENWFKLVIILLALFFLYFSQIRPYMIRQDCSHSSLPSLKGVGFGSVNSDSSFSERYSECLKARGL